MGKREKLVFQHTFSIKDGEVQLWFLSILLLPLRTVQIRFTSREGWGLSWELAISFLPSLTAIACWIKPKSCCFWRHRLLLWHFSWKGFSFRMGKNYFSTDNGEQNEKWMFFSSHISQSLSSALFSFSDHKVICNLP